MDCPHSEGHLVGSGCDHFPLSDGCHTSFMIIRCDSCGALRGFPHDNLLLAVKQGTEEGLKLLEKSGFDLEALRKEIAEKENDIQAENQCD